jgi:hypothetical protein
MENSDYENMTSEDATSQIDSIMSDKEHLYHSPTGTAGRQGAIDHVGNLFKVKHNEYNSTSVEIDPTLSPTDQLKQGVQWSPEQVDAMNIAVAETPTPADQLKQSIAADLEVINRIQGSEFEIEGEPTQSKAEAYSQMRLLAERNFKDLQPSILKDLRYLGEAQHKIDLLNMFFATADPENVGDIKQLDYIIREIYGGKKAKRSGNLQAAQ